jgi:hypothetical protein
MTDIWIESVLGFLTGGLALSALWGLFWLAISLIGLSRGTCEWRIVLMSSVGGGVPLILAMALVWWMGGLEHMTPVFAAGLMGMPMVVLGFWLRRMPDGRRAGTHLASGVRHLTEDLLGRHEGCGGCHEGDDQRPCR